MRRSLMVHELALFAFGVAALIAACRDDSSSGANRDAGDDAPSIDAGDADHDDAIDASRADSMADASSVDADADATREADAASVGSLTLTLDPTIDVAGDTVKAASITSVDLLATSGAKLASATVSAGAAVISLAGMTPGDYFLKVNGDDDDLVPTRIDDPSKDVSQRVGTMLRASYIGPVTAPVYRINTYSAGQGRPPVVKFSDGTAIAPAEQPYIFVTLSPPRVEFKVLGTAALLSSYAPIAVHVSNNVPFDAWTINTDGLDHHGDMFMADGGAATCATCHWSMGTKPMTYASGKSTSGWCFRCHFGTAGSDTGFVDPTK